jgi:hypothetical protein
MTKENIMLYFNNKYIYNTIISAALFMAALSFLDGENINLFVWLLCGFYAIELLFRLHDLHISLRHRIISVYPEKIKSAITEILGFNVLRVAEFVLYFTVAFFMYHSSGILFVINFAVVMFAIIRIMLTVFFTVCEIREEWNYHKMPLVMPEEFENYITNNRVFIKRIADSIDDPKKIVDQNVEIFKINKPNQINLGYHKTPIKINVLSYNNHLYDIKGLNDYINKKNKKFETLTNAELDVYRI